MRDITRNRAPGSSANTDQRAGTETQMSEKGWSAPLVPGLPNPLFPWFLALCAEVEMKENAARYFDPKIRFWKISMLICLETAIIITKS